MIGLAFSFSAGFLYHLAAFGYFLGFALLYFQDMGLYLNHFYLIVMLNLAYCFLPANRYFSVDAWLGLVRRSATVDYWTVWFVRMLISVVYFYAGVAKMNEDWIRCYPLRHWVPSAHILPPLEWFGIEWVQVNFIHSVYLQEK